MNFGRKIILKPVLSKNPPLHISHRGGAKLYPENTIFAFKKCIENFNTDMIELDVNSTKDGVIVVIHDKTVDRTTNGTGKVLDLTLNEIKKLDAGYRFTLDGGKTFPFREKGVKIPTLEEVFKTFPDMRFTIEIKQNYPPIEKELFELIKKTEMKEKVIVACYYDDVIKRFRRISSDIATSFSKGEIRRAIIFSKLHLMHFYSPKIDVLQTPIIYGNSKIYSSKLVRDCHKLEIYVHIWTIDDEEEMKMLFLDGVDGIMSDRPDILDKVMKEMNYR